MCLEELQNGGGKPLIRCSIEKNFVQFSLRNFRWTGSSADRIHTEGKCQVVVSDFVYIGTFAFSINVIQLVQRDKLIS